LLDAPLRGAVLAVQQLELAQPEQLTWILDCFVGALLRHFVILPQKRGQAQRFQMMV
jgi:hypothetical protein